MENRLLKIFQLQVALQCKFLIRALEDTNKSDQARDIEGIFFGIQNLLNAGANISKALWGQGLQLASERKPLRESLGVSDASPLIQVKMRNNFEHFDEKIDKWWRTSKHKNYVDTNVGPKGFISGVETGDMFRNYDPQTTDLVFWGQEINIGALVNEARAILSRLDA